MSQETQVPYSFRSFSRETSGLLLQSLSFKRLRRAQTGQSSPIRSCVLGDTAEAGCFLPAFLTSNLETLEDVPRSDLSCETQKSAGYKGLPAASTKTEICCINVIRTINHISRGRKTPWTGHRSITGHTPLLPRVAVSSQSSKTARSNNALMENMRSNLQIPGPPRERDHLG